ncbi:MAG: membrane protein insertase YidC [bacterium]
MSFVSPVTNVLYTAVSWVLLRWHDFFVLLGMDKDAGATWALSIVFLVITVRLLLFRFFIKQVHYQRRMQELAPQIQKIKDKHKGDRAAQQRAMMEFQQQEGFNALGGCLPILFQAPVFLALFHVLRHVSNASQAGYPENLKTIYGFTAAQTQSAAVARLFGDAPLAASFHDSAEKVQLLGGDLGTLRTVTIVLAVISALATFVTQKQASRNATTTPTGQAAQIQKIMLYVIPVFVLGSGVIFPLGVLIYWFTSNLWTMGQQFYIYKFHPHVPSAAVVEPARPVGKALAPKPGAKPTNPRTARPATTETPTSSAGTSTAAVSDGARSVSRTAAPRPGARPAGSSSRPAKKSGQRTKKR